MTKRQKPTLYLKTYKLLLYFHRLIHNFRKEYKHNLGKSIIDLTWQMLDSTIEANALPNHQKEREIKNISIAFDKLKIRLRIAHELKQISHKQYSYIIRQNEEIGKMIHGWQNWANKQKRGD
jgi:hypothetical protein